VGLFAIIGSLVVIGGLVLGAACIIANYQYRSRGW